MVERKRTKHQQEESQPVGLLTSPTGQGAKLWERENPEFGLLSKEDLNQERIALERALARIAELEQQLDCLETELRKRN